MSSRKHSARPAGGPGASRANRKRPPRSKPRGGPSQGEVKAGNAQKREQRKRANPANTVQQGNRANVRQNTIRQGNRRGA
jgi:hypothetical protein